MFALQLAPLSTRPRWRIELVHLPALAVFAVCHIGGFMLIRHAVYAAAGSHNGRQPLMRGPLSALEAGLASQGFVRTHRSWLVNAAKITSLAPEGSGDYRVELGQVAAPLSRRYRRALAQLRGG